MTKKDKELVQAFVDTFKGIKEKKAKNLTTSKILSAINLKRTTSGNEPTGLNATELRQWILDNLLALEKAGVAVISVKAPHTWAIYNVAEAETPADEKPASITETVNVVDGKEVPLDETPEEEEEFTGEVDITDFSDIHEMTESSVAYMRLSDSFDELQKFSELYVKCCRVINDAVKVQPFKGLVWDFFYKLVEDGGNQSAVVKQTAGYLSELVLRDMAVGRDSETSIKRYLRVAMSRTTLEIFGNQGLVQSSMSSENRKIYDDMTSLVESVKVQITQDELMSIASNSWIDVEVKDVLGRIANENSRGNLYRTLEAMGVDANKTSTLFKDN